MRQEQSIGWLKPWRQRTSAWGAWLDEQHILLVSLVLQAAGSVRVAMFEHQHAPVGLVPPDAPDDGLVQQLGAVGARLPRRERLLALALHESRCRQGVYQPVAALNPAQLAAEVQLEAAGVWGVAPQDLGFDFEPAQDPTAEPNVNASAPVHWAACLRQDLQQWQGHARRAGWRLPVVEPGQQAACRAANCLRGDVLAQWAQSPQDWQFERRPVRRLDEAECQALRDSPQWGPLVACGAALGLMA